MMLISLADIEKKYQHTHAHRLLGECLRPFGIEYSEEHTVRGQYGKPFLPEHPEICFNISHADGICACIAGKGEYGIDCEKVHPYRQNVVKKVFSEREQELFGVTPESQRDMLFFRLWTLKESYIKAIGMGLSFPMNKAEFILSENGFSTNLEGYKFKQYMIHGQFIVSVCTAID